MSARGVHSDEKTSPTEDQPAHQSWLSASIAGHEVDVRATGISPEARKAEADLASEEAPVAVLLSHRKNGVHPEGIGLLIKSESEGFEQRVREVAEVSFRRR